MKMKMTINIPARKSLAGLFIAETIMVAYVLGVAIKTNSEC